MSNNPSFLGFLPFFLSSSRFNDMKRGDLRFWEPKSILVVFFRGKVVLFFARAYFSGIFWIFSDVFELDMLL